MSALARTVGQLREMIAQLPDEMPISPTFNEFPTDEEPGVTVHGLRVGNGRLEVLVDLEYGSDDDDEEDDYNVGDDLCDQCMRSGVRVYRTNSKGETVCEDCDATYEEEE